MVSQGVDIKTAAEKLSTKYDVAESTIKKDYYNRKKWLKDVFEVDDPEKIVNDIMAEQKLVKQEQWKLYRETQKENIKLGVLKEIQNSNESLLEIAQEVGQVDKPADEIEMIHSGKIDEETAETISDIIDEIE